MIDIAELDAEYVSSCILKGRIYPEEYLRIRSALNDLQTIQTVPQLELLKLELDDLTRTSFGILDDKKVEQIASGTNPTIISLVNTIYRQIDEMLPWYNQALMEKFADTMFTFVQNFTGQDFLGYGQAINAMSSDVEFMNVIRDTRDKLEFAKVRCKYILENAGTVEFMGKAMKLHPGINPEYRMYITKLASTPQLYSGYIQLAASMGRVLGVLTSIFPSTPKPPADPFVSYEINNIIDTLCNPKDFYKMCDADKIISKKVGAMFGMCYPAYYLKFAQMYLEKFDKMSYQDKLTFERCFNLMPDQSQLLQTVSAVFASPI